MFALCSDPNCNLPAHHEGKHAFVCRRAWEAQFSADDANKIQKAGYCTPRGGDKGGYQNHVNRNSRVIIPYEKLPEVDLHRYRDGFVIRLFPTQYFSAGGTVREEFLHDAFVQVGTNAFVLYRTYEDLEAFPPLPDWQLCSTRKYDPATRSYSIASNDRRGDFIDCGHYLLRISNSGTNKRQKCFRGPAQGIFAPEYADAHTNFLCQAVLAWLIIKTEDSPYHEEDFPHLQAILDKHGLLTSPHYEADCITRGGKTACPLCHRVIRHSELNEMISFDEEEGLINSGEQAGSTRSTRVNLFHMVPLCYTSLENIPTQVSWGHAVCNTRLGQRRCFSYAALRREARAVRLGDAQGERLLGYASEGTNFIRSENGDVWIRIARGEEREP